MLRLLTTALLLVLPVTAFAFNPGDRVPAFTVETLDGPFRVGGKAVLPIVVTCYDSSEPLSRAMWRSPASLRDFLHKAPPTVSFLFLSYSETNAAEEALWMRQQLLKAADATKLPAARRRALFARLHFVSQPAMKAKGWLPSLLQQWQYTERRTLAATIAPSQQGQEGTAASASTITAGRLDVAYWWNPFGASGVSGPITFAGTDCSWLNSTSVLSSINGTVALVQLSTFPSVDVTHPCSYAKLTDAVAAAGAATLLLEAPPGADLVEATCSDPGPESPINYSNRCSNIQMLPVTMVNASTGRAVRRGLAGGGVVNISFDMTPTNSYFFGIDAKGRLFEGGWIKFASLMQAAWAAQWQVYLKGLDARLAEPALVVPVFTNATMEGEHGVQVTARMPAAAKLAGRTRLELDVALSCPGTTDDTCPVWDHAVQLFVCCNDPAATLPPCTACPTTVWRRRKLMAAMRYPSGTLATAGDAAVAAAVTGSTASTLLCGQELGRWMTSFRRRIGHWTTDVSPLLPLLIPGQQCSFTMQSTAWAGTWQASLSLRFKQGKAGAPRPTQLLPLPFVGGNVNASYNSQYKPYKFATPGKLRRAVISSYITGHGSDEFGCGEFCVSQHVFVVNGRRHSLTFTEGGSTWGCADQVLLGTTPDEHGTWHLGRGGWCNGRDVKPWVADITAALLPAGRTNTIRYLGLLNGTTPNPAGGAGGDMMMSSNLVMYTAQPA